MDEVQAEDYIVMQMEIAWGMKEMKRYRSHRGDFPTREDSKDPTLRAKSNSKRSREETSNFDRVNEQLHATFRGKAHEEEPGAHEEVVSPSSNKTDGYEYGTKLKQPGATKDVDVNDTINLLLDTKTAVRTVGEYWNFLISMF